jgi:hypothetical protein
MRVLATKILPPRIKRPFRPGQILLSETRCAFSPRKFFPRESNARFDPDKSSSLESDARSRRQDSSSENQTRVSTPENHPLSTKFPSPALPDGTGLPGNDDFGRFVPETLTRPVKTAGNLAVNPLGGFSCPSGEISARQDGGPSEKLPMRGAHAARGDGLRMSSGTSRHNRGLSVLTSTQRRAR